VVWLPHGVAPVAATSPIHGGDGDDWPPPNTFAVVAKGMEDRPAPSSRRCGEGKAAAFVTVSV